MRKFMEHISLMERVDQLIRLKATGRPKELARRLEVSEATVFRIIEVMRDMQAPIKYDWTCQSYVYEYEATFRCGFFVQALGEGLEKRISGGYGTRRPSILTFFRKSLSIFASRI